MMATASSENDSSRKNTDNKENDNKDEQNTMFECNICLDNAKDAVVSVCGHLFWLVSLLYNNNFNSKLTIYLYVNLTNNIAFY